MVVLAGLLLFCSIKIAALAPEQYDPCSFTKYLETELKWAVDYYFQNNVQLIGCIAGYRDYYTQHELIHPNGTVFYGIFGLRETDDFCSKGYLTNTDLIQDFACLKQFLNDPVHMKMYERLCERDVLRETECSRRKKLVAFAPKYPKLFDETFGEEDDIVEYLAARNISYYKNRNNRKNTKSDPNHTSPYTRIQQKIDSVFKVRSRQVLYKMMFEQIWLLLSYVTWRCITKKLCESHSATFSILCPYSVVDYLFCLLLLYKFMSVLYY